MRKNWVIIVNDEHSAQIRNAGQSHLRVHFTEPDWTKINNNNLMRQTTNRHTEGKP